MSTGLDYSDSSLATLVRSAGKVSKKYFVGATEHRALKLAHDKMSADPVLAKKVKEMLAE